MEAKLLDEKTVVMDLIQVATIPSNLVEVWLLPVYRPLTLLLCDGSQVHVPRAHHHVRLR